LKRSRTEGNVQAEGAQTIFQPNDFLLASKLANVNLPELVAQLAVHHLVPKIAGFADTLVRQRAEVAAPATLGAAMLLQQGLLKGDSAPVRKCYPRSCMCSCIELLSMPAT
jgi:hypothetical protein